MGRKKKYAYIFIPFITFLLIYFTACSPSNGDAGLNKPAEAPIVLPAPNHSGNVSVEEAIFRRRSTRSFSEEPLTIENLSQLLWAAAGKTVDGVTGPTRAYPSAGGINPLEIYVVAGNVRDLPAGVYRYNWRNHSIENLKSGDFRHELTRAALGQQMIQIAPLSIVIAADTDKTSARYGRRGAERYVNMDVGGAGQNIHLQAEAIGLGTVVVGAFNDREVRDAAAIRQGDPLYIMPVGKRR